MSNILIGGGSGGGWYTPAMYAKENARGKDSVVLDLISSGTLTFADYVEAVGTDNWSSISGIDSVVLDLISSGTLTFAELCSLVGEPSWADSGFDFINIAMQLHYASAIDIHEYFHIGDTRTVELAAMASSAGGTQAAQSVDLVLMSADHYDLSDGSGKAAFVFQQRHSLATTGYMNSSNTNANGWDGCARRTWCNSVYKAALPSELQSLLKQVDVVTASAGNVSTTKTSQDYIFLPAEREVFGTNTYANSTAEAGLKQWTWYADSSNSKIKNVGSSANAWWERSPYGSNTTYFCYVNSDGTASTGGASGANGLAPAGCI